MILKIKLLNYDNNNYLYVKFKNIDKKELILLAEKNKKEVFKCHINLQDLQDNEIIYKFIKLDKNPIWFYYVSNGKKCYINNFNETNVEKISENFISKYFYDLSKKDFIEKLYEMGDNK
jgi:hypothetical protein